LPVSLSESNPRKRLDGPPCSHCGATGDEKKGFRSREGICGRCGALLPESNPRKRQSASEPVDTSNQPEKGDAREPSSGGENERGGNARGSSGSLTESNPSNDPPSADLFDDPQYTVDALGELLDALQRLVGRLRERNISAVELAREWDGLDLPSVVPVLREATRTIDLLSGHNWEGEPPDDAEPYAPETTHGDGLTA
jgi:hypothetical protein